MKILPVRVLDQNGGGVASNVASGVIWAADHGARVINLSLGGGQADGIQQAIQYANSKGAVVCAAAGNGNAGNTPMYPAAYPQAIAVAAVDSNLQHMSGGNTGNYIDVSAPGVNIASTWGSSPTRTHPRPASMATPTRRRRRADHLRAPIAFGGPSRQAARVEGDRLGPRGATRCSVTASSTRSPRWPPRPARRASASGHGYWVVSSDGRVRPFGRRTSTATCTVVG